MNGARQYASLFVTGQYGRLYIVSGSHARGRTFRIYVLPTGEAAISNGEHNGPLNKDAVEVYGIVSGHPGWTESYGWLRNGPWQKDFQALCIEREMQLEDQRKDRERELRKKMEEEEMRVQQLLSGY